MWAVREALAVECPHCGETFTLALDPSKGVRNLWWTTRSPCCALLGARDLSCGLNRDRAAGPMTVTVRPSDDGELEGLDVVAAWGRGNQFSLKPRASSSFMLNGAHSSSSCSLASAPAMLGASNKAAPSSLSCKCTAHGPDGSAESWKAEP